MFRINPASGKAIYEQIMEQVKEAAWKGYLKPGDGLPSVRKLALHDALRPQRLHHHLPRFPEILVQRKPAVRIAARH